MEQLRGSGREAELCERCETLATENARLTQELDELRTKLAGELEQVRRAEGERRVSLEREVERLTGDCGVVRDEASALRYQLSSSTMELQQMKEVSLWLCPENVVSVWSTLRHLRVLLSPCTPAPIREGASTDFPPRQVIRPRAAAPRGPRETACGPGRGGGAA